LRSNGFAGDEIRVRRQARIQELLDRIPRRSRRDELPGWQGDEASRPAIVVAVLVIVVVVPIVLAFLLVVLPVVLTLLQICTRLQGEMRPKSSTVSLKELAQWALRHDSPFVGAVARLSGEAACAGRGPGSR
jgi:hypothetical protein